MEFIDPKKVEDIEEARKHLLELQTRLIDAENFLDDLARATEIAQITRQYQVTNVFVEQSQEFLKDRLVLPDLDTSSAEMKINVWEGEADAEDVKALRDKMAEAGSITIGPTDQDSVERARKQLQKSFQDKQ